MQQNPQSLTTVLQQLQHSFDQQFRRWQFWAEAEVLQIKYYKSRVYLDLVEYDEYGSVRAKSKAIIWESELMDCYLKGSGLPTSEALLGQTIAFQGHWSLHSQWGLSIIVDEISVAYTQGKLLQKKADIKASLIHRGLWGKNKSTQLALPPYAIAVISSAQSEGLGDFLAILESSEYRFSYELFVSRVHGDEAKQDIREQLHSIQQKILGGVNFSAVLITRGGGSPEGLLRQNDAGVAELICDFPIPVILATGHTSDTSLLDELVWYSAKTPTDAAYFLLQEMESRFAVISQSFFAIQALITQRNYTYIQQTINMYEQIRSLIKQQYSYLDRQTIRAWNAIAAVRPETVLKQGYAVLREKDGQRYLSHKQILALREGDHLQIETYGKNILVAIVET